MSTDTHGIISKDFTQYDIAHAIKEVFGGEISTNFRKETFYHEGGFSGIASFEYKGEPQSIFVCQSTDQEEGTEFDWVLHTAFSMRMPAVSVKIMRTLVSFFGGYVDASDCDDIGNYRVDKDGTVHPPVLR